MSNDGYVVDGHHQWLAAKDKIENVKAIILDAPIKKLLPLVHEFPSSEISRVSEGALSDGAQSRRTVAGAPSAVSGESGTKLPEAGGKDEGAFVSAPNDGYDFGEITPEIAKALGRQAGKIRLEEGNESYGLRHIEIRHSEDIRRAGFADVQSFVADIARNMAEIWKPSKTTQLVAIRRANNDRIMYIQLQAARDDAGDYYTVNTAFPARSGYVKNKGWKKLWESRAQLSHSASSEQNPFAVPSPDAGETATIPSGQSTDNIAPATDNGKTLRDSAGTSTTTDEAGSPSPWGQSGTDNVAASASGDKTSSDNTASNDGAKPEVQPADYGANNKLVSQDRAAELRKKLKAKFSQLNSGIDPEILAIGTELAVFHIEAGVRKFSAFAKAMAAGVYLDL